MYYRVNTNHVTAFQGVELDEARWSKTFAHYMNLVLCELVLSFLEWYGRLYPTAPELSTTVCDQVAHSLRIDSGSHVRQLLDNLLTAKASFEGYINNVADEERQPLSLQGAPIDALVRGIMGLEHFRGKSFFFLLDEYENFVDYQQCVVNTLVKHAESYTFKIGVRELGWRVRTTLNPNEQLVHPADYERISISEKLQGAAFRDFAVRACNERLSEIKTDSNSLPDIQSLLPDLTEEEEAELLDSKGDGIAKQSSDRLARVVPTDQQALFAGMSLLEKYFLVFWADSHGTTLENIWQDFVSRRERWRTRCGNYKHALLYTLRRKKRGIQKYFAGSSVFAQLAAGNVRYFFNLVHESLLSHVRAGATLGTRVSFETQTLAAQEVGKSYLSELEGLSVHGAQLTKLLLGLGRVFQLMATEVAGHAPEVNQFHIAEGPQETASTRDSVDTLLTGAVMHLALLRFPGSKLADVTDTREYDYMVHPIYCPFFVFSCRRKRRMMLSGEHLLGLVSRPRQTIRQVLLDQRRHVEDELPEQLLLFEAFYDSGS